MVVVSPRRRRSDAARVVRGSRWLTHRPVPSRRLRHDPRKNTSQVHKAIDKAGYLGIALYILGFGLSELLHLPAMVFVVAGVLCWGHFKGWLLALIMAPLSCCLSFLVVRKIGGQVLADSQWSFVQKLMAKLDEYPVRTVVTLRLCFFLAPAINYVLALSSISFKNFFVGTAAGLAGPLTIAVFFIDRLIEYMGWSKVQNAEIGAALHELGDEFEFGAMGGRHGRGAFF